MIKMQEEIYTKDEYYQDWKSDNINHLQSDYLEEHIIKELHKENVGYLPEYILKWVKKSIHKTYNNMHLLGYFDSDDFEAYCRQQYKDSD